MSFENELNKLYEKIAYQVHDTIPTEWDTFCFNGEVKEKDGGVFFFSSQQRKRNMYSLTPFQTYTVWIIRFTAKNFTGCFN
ncbi:immunity protein YezG family protein [Rossellomorea sp. H39__3]